MNIFVYGSLRRYGQLNTYLENSTFLGEKKTKPEFTLYSLGPFPAMVANGATAITGEVYDISDGVRNLLDRVEGHPHLYVRSPIELEDGSKVEAYIFPYEPHEADVVTSGNWFDFSTKSYEV